MLKRLAVLTAVMAACIYQSASANARLQVVHNAADPAAATVDIYVNTDLFIDDFNFRTATAYVDVPSMVNLEIGVAPGNSSSVADVIVSFDFFLLDGVTYGLVANGVLDPGSFVANPDGRDIGFNLYPISGLVENAPAGMVNVVAFHGATDAPAVDVFPLYTSLFYGEHTAYAQIPADFYVLEIRPAGDPNKLVSYDVDLSGAGGLSAIAFASGFLSPVDNQNGEAFGLFAALPDGTVIEFPEESPTAVNDMDFGLPTTFELAQNYPNPFNPGTVIEFSLPERTHVTLNVYNIVGQKIKTLLNGEVSEGPNRVHWEGKDDDGFDVATGVYLYRLEAGNLSDTKKMTLLR